uniref:Uncharacterized protein TCIL3000_3_1110 n=1 Tax=Trypanosoma congolense (strain IL3000) TaxID=1068625 RepID=G0UJY1_TRYCI|nr:unnamed protein product [Trypanosoma congolense IL3000]
MRLHTCGGSSRCNWWRQHEDSPHLFLSLFFFLLGNAAVAYSLLYNREVCFGGCLQLVVKCVLTWTNVKTYRNLICWYLIIPASTFIVSFFLLFVWDTAKSTSPSTPLYLHCSEGCLWSFQSQVNSTSRRTGHVVDLKGQEPKIHLHRSGCTGYFCRSRGQRGLYLFIY